jgi:hypothetical protein
LAPTPIRRFPLRLTIFVGLKPYRRSQSAWIPVRFVCCSWCLESLSWTPGLPSSRPWSRTSASLTERKEGFYRSRVGFFSLFSGVGVGVGFGALSDIIGGKRGIVQRGRIFHSVLAGNASLLPTLRIELCFPRFVGWAQHYRAHQNWRMTFAELYRRWFLGCRARHALAGFKPGGVGPAGIHCSPRSGGLRHPGHHDGHRR